MKAEEMIKQMEGLQDTGMGLEICRRLGQQAYEAKEYDDAILYFNKVLEREPHLAEVYRERGAAYYAKGDREQAERDMMCYFRENPGAASELSGNFDAEGREGGCGAHKP